MGNRMGVWLSSKLRKNKNKTVTLRFKGAFELADDKYVVDDV
jgi:hypothetical protein